MRNCWPPRRWPPLAARAQDAACKKDLQNFVGLPVSSAALAAVGTVMAGHFSARTRDGPTTTVTAGDLKQLGRVYKDADINACEMRREFRAMASSGVPDGGGIPGTYPGAVGPSGIPYGSGPHPYGRRVAASPRARFRLRSAERAAGPGGGRGPLRRARRRSGLLCGGRGADPFASTVCVAAPAPARR